MKHCACPEKLLPEELLKKASVSVGGEHAWKMIDFENVVSSARVAGVAVVGGQVQFQFDPGTCEAYWLNYDSSPRIEGESWEAYVQRSASDVMNNFRTLCEETDFYKEAMNWEFIRNKIENEDINPLDHLWFILYFEAKDTA